MESRRLQINDEAHVQKELGYYLTSGTLHVLLFLTVVFLKPDASLIQAPPVVEVEFSNSPATNQQGLASSKGIGPKHKADVPTTIEQDRSQLIVVPTTRKGKISQPKLKAEQKSKAQLNRASMAAKAEKIAPKKQVAQKQSKNQGKQFAPVVHTADSEFETPQQAQNLKKKASESDAKKAAALSEAALDSDFDQIDREAEAEIAAAREHAEKETQKALQEQEQANERARKQQLQEAKALAAATLAQQQGQQTANVQTGNAIGNGGMNEVQSLGAYQQMDGNAKPQYDIEDRLARRQGQIIFHAFVNRDGSLSQFRMIQSSKHRTLDAKTLKALKTWRFKPGQQGWVELPFKWDLVGGAQAIKGQLRTQ